MARPRNRLLGAIRAIVAPPRIDDASALARASSGFRLDAARTGDARVPGVRALGGVPFVFIRLGTKAAVYTSDRSNGETFAPMLVGNTIVFCDRLEQACYACDLPSRARRWKYAFPAIESTVDRILVGEPAIEGGAIFVGTTIGTYAIDLARGTLRWKSEVATETAIAANDGAIFVADRSGVVHLLGANDGGAKSKIALEEPVVAAIACGAGKLFAQTATRVVAIEAGSGKVAWEAKTRAPTWHVAVRPSVAFADGVVFASGDAALLAFDASSGATRWKFDEATPRAAIAISGGRVFVAGSIDRYGAEGSGDVEQRASLFSLDASSGAVRWRVDLDDYVRSAPVVAGDVVYLFEALRGRADPFRLHAFDASTGRSLWSYADFAVSSEPVAASGCILYGTNKGVVKAIW